MTIFFLQKERAVFKKTDSLEPQARKYRSSDAVGDMSYEEWQESRIEKTRDIEYQTRVGEAIRQGYVNEYKAVRESAVDNRGESGIIRSGAITGALEPDSKRAQEHAEQYYESVRHMTGDIKRISENTSFSEDEIASIKRFVFEDAHDLGDGAARRFDPSYEMAESWQRLIDGKDIQPHDLTLLKHEQMEMSLMQSGVSQDEAHIEASRVYNYNKEVAEFYDKAGANQEPG